MESFQYITYDNQGSPLNTNNTHKLGTRPKFDFYILWK